MMAEKSPGNEPTLLVPTVSESIEDSSVVCIKDDHFGTNTNKLDSFDNCLFECKNG